MPEYSSTTITPADGVQLPAQNGGTSGNFQLSALRSFILASKGQANGLAGLGSDGKLDPSQVPGNLDDVLVYATRSNFPATGTAGKIYITADNNKMYRWDDALATPDYVELSIDLSDYATKTELAAEESARSAADTNLKNALTAVDHRVQNLEQAKGDYVAVDSDKGVITTPSGKGKWAVVEKLRGVSRAVNQLFKAKTIVSFCSKVTDYQISITFDSSFASYPVPMDTVPTINGHKYLLYIKADSGTNIRTAVNGIIPYYSETDLVNGVVSILTGNGNNCAVQLAPMTAGQAGSGNVYFFFRDLTLYFGSSVPTLAEIQTYYPWLLSPSAYGTSLVDSVYEGVKSVGVNIFDGVMESGAISTSDGQNTSDGTKERSTNYIPTGTYTDLYFTKPMTVFEYDYAKNYITYGDYSSAWHVVLQANTRFIRFCTPTSSGNEIQICDNSYADKTTYHPYMENTLSLPTPITLRSAGSVADTDELNVEVLVDGQRVKKRRQTINTVDIDLGALTENDWQGTSPVFYILTTDARFSNLTPAPNSTTAINAIIGKGIVPIARQTMYNDSTQNMVACDSGAFYIKLNSLGATPTKAQVVAFLNGCHLIGGAITPTATLLAPIQNPTLLTEAGGTITAQTEEPIDGNFSVGFITL